MDEEDVEQENEDDGYQNKHNNMGIPESNNDNSELMQDDQIEQNSNSEDDSITKPKKRGVIFNRDDSSRLEDM